MKALIRFVWTMFTCLLGSLSLNTLNNSFIGRNICANCKFGVSISADINQRGLCEVVEVHRFTPTERQTPSTNIEKLVLEHKLGEKTSKCLYWKPYPEAAGAFELQQGASSSGQGGSWCFPAPLHLLCLPTLQCSAPSQPFHSAHPLVATTQAELLSLNWLPQLHGEPSSF